MILKVSVDLIHTSSMLSDLFTYSTKYMDIAILQACKGGQVIETINATYGTVL